MSDHLSLSISLSLSIYLSISISLPPPSTAMSKKHTPARSSNAATSSSYGGFGSPSTFSPTASQLSYVNEPPDLSHVLDGNLVVLFKNLLKKDDTTKAKALEDLQNMLGGLSGIEEPVLAAWVGFLLYLAKRERKREKRWKNHAEW